MYPQRRPWDFVAIAILLTCYVSLQYMQRTLPRQHALVQRPSERPPPADILPQPSEPTQRTASIQLGPTPQPECTRYDFASSILEDILVVMKTGATEIHQKLPVHFSTTLSCIPHFTIFSDMKEEVEGHVVHDVLESISEGVKEKNWDFELYHQLQRYRAKGKPLPEHVLDSGKAAWNLDKWKFLPMMDEAVRVRPDAKWYIFIETDTAVVWSNLLTWLKKFDPERQWYIGGQAWMGDFWFAHGGTGFIMSSPAVQLVAENWRTNQTELEMLTSREWAGDAILALVMNDLGVNLTTAWPILQGETPFTLDYTSNHWCFPVVTYHHMNASWIQAVSDFEEDWSSEHPNDVLRHRDGFDQFVMPHLLPELMAWDNLSSEDEDGIPESIEDCRKVCEEKTLCLQWLYAPGKCKTGDVVRLGSPKEYVDDSQAVVSGWMISRIEAFKTRQPDPCVQDWITS